MRPATLTFFEWLTLYFCRYGSNCEPLHNLSRGVIDVPVFELLILKTVRLHVEMFFEWLTLHAPLGVRKNCEPLHDLSRGVVDVTVKFELLILKTVRYVEITFFEWLTLYFWPLLRYSRIVNLSTTSSVKLLTYLWSINWCGFENCANASWINFFEFDPLFLTPRAEGLWTPPQPVPRSHWRSCEVWTSYLKNWAIARRNYVSDFHFWPLWGYGKHREPLHVPVPHRRSCVWTS